MKNNKETKVNRKRKIEKMIKACGYQRNDINNVIKMYQPLYPEFEDFIGYLKEQSEYKKADLAVRKEFARFNLEIEKLDTMLIEANIV